MTRTTVSKPEIISAIKATARRLKRTPTRSEFERITGIHWMKVQRMFGGYRVAVREAGLEPDPGGIRIDTAAMLEDFGRLARRLKRHPTRDEYEKLGRYASASLETRFHRWSAVRESFLEFVARNGLEREWGDVAERLRNGPVPRRGGGKAWLKPKPILPQICADERRSTSRWGQESEGGRSGQSGRGGTEREFTAEPVRAEILYPQLRGMRCVTRTVFWALSAFGNITPLKLGGMEEREGRQDDNRISPGQLKLGNEDHGIALMRKTSTDMSVCATQARKHATLSSDRSVSIPADRRPGLPGTPVSTPAWPEETEQGITAGASTQTSPVPTVPPTQGGSNLYFRRRVIPGRPVMGAPFMLHGLACEPVNEAGVMFLFGMVAHRLGFWVESLQMGYPDCEAKLEMEPGLWQHVRIEFEYESRHFRAHGHDEKKCDILVCWRHNWKGCPREIQVVELRAVLGRSSVGKERDGEDYADQH